MSLTTTKQTARNAERAEDANRAVMALQIATGIDRDDAIAVLLRDLMHLCDAEGTYFREQLERAQTHYWAELLED